MFTENLRHIDRDSISRGKAEADRINELIRRAGGIVQYMKGPPYPPAIKEKEEDRRVIPHGEREPLS